MNFRDGLAKTVRYINTNRKQGTSVDHLIVGIGMTGITSQFVFQIVASMPQSASRQFRKSQLIDGTVERNLKSIYFSGPELDERLKQVGELKKLIQNLDEFYGCGDWQNKF